MVLNIKFNSGNIFIWYGNVMFDKRILRNLDYVLIGAVLLLNLISIVMIGSATGINSQVEDSYWFMERQSIFLLINMILVVISLRFDYDQLERFAMPLYIFNIIMLLAVMFVGQSALGAQRWIQIGPVSVQPSEFAKLIMIIVLAKVLNDRKNSMNTLLDALPVIGLVMIPFVLVLKQPDLGTSLVFIAILLVMLYVTGLPMKFYVYMVGSSVALAPVFWYLLRDHQKKRILVFLDPEKDPQGSGYHIIQSKIAIGSGMLTGKGLFNGTQSQLNFLPENHTDFIFSVIGEELGFIGVLVVLILYAVVFYRGLKIAMEAKDDFGSLLAIGIVAMLAFHVLVNVGMTIGIMPVTGIPLPFLSYGVSALTTNMVCLGLLLNIKARSKNLFF